MDEKIVHTLRLIRQSFYLVRLPVEGGIIIEPLSFVLRDLADLVPLSAVLGDASFL